VTVKEGSASEPPVSGPRADVSTVLVTKEVVPPKQLGSLTVSSGAAEAEGIILAW
jgi:hypothetical protein